MLYDYLESFDSLKSFCFLESTQPLEPLNPMPVFTILPGHSKSTLTKLSLYSNNGNATAKPPFKQLEVLRELYVGWRTLLPRPNVTGEEWEDLLPQSLEALTIHDHYVNDKLYNWNAPVITKRFHPVVEDLISSKIKGIVSRRLQLCRFLWLSGEARISLGETLDGNRGGGAGVPQSLWACRHLLFVQEVRRVKELGGSTTSRGGA